MLSTNSPTTGASRRRMPHRRQNSTPAAFETPDVHQMPANPRRHNRTGMSLDLRGLNLESIHAPIQPSQPSQGPYPEQSTVSITNLGQPPQHTMQVAQTHSQHQPGPPEAFLRSPVQISPMSPRSPRHTFRPRSPTYRPRSPTYRPRSPLSHSPLSQSPISHSPRSPARPPTEQQLKDLHEHIQSVYGSCGQVFINILPTPSTLPTPSAIPQKSAQLPSHESATPLPRSFTDMAEINLEPTPRAMSYDFEHTDDADYDSSTYYNSDVSPSPLPSPRHKPSQSFLQGIEEHPSDDLNFSHQPTLLPALDPSISMHGLPLSAHSYDHPSVFNDLEVDASMEYTGIAPEEVQRYISEQDAETNKWMCLYQDCGKVFGRRENIRSHVQTHLGDRQYKCNGCGKCFVRQHDLKRHAKIHTGNKPYKCPCGAGFARQDALTRHRQRGMCVGGFADAVRRQAKRGRPKKQRPDEDERTDKANRTRRALVSAASSVSAESPASEVRSPSATFEGYEASQSQLLPGTSNFNAPLNSSTDTFNFGASSSPYPDEAEASNTSFASSASFTAGVASLSLLQHLHRESNTPPLSPSEQPRPRSREAPAPAPVERKSSPLKVSCSPSPPSPKGSPVQSNPFTTPPSSPVQPKTELEELFDIQNENPCSQFDLEMKAMGDFTSIDSGSYDFLDFGV